jgi:hypothetical protein
MKNKFFWPVAATVVGGLILALILKWTPVVAAWSAIEGVVCKIGEAFTKSISMPLWVLILILAPYVVVLGLLIWTTVDSFRNRSAGTGNSASELDFREHYKRDAIYGVIWRWRWSTDYNDVSSPTAITPMCPKSNCRSDLTYVRTLSHLRCERCGFIKHIQSRNLTDDIAREIVSQQRTENWVNAQERLKDLKEQYS